MPAIQKPGKLQSPVENLRLITLLSKFQYILATCLKKWIIPKIATETPPSQPAYRKYRTNTEHVLSTKLLTEKESRNIAKNTLYARHVRGIWKDTGNLRVKYLKGLSFLILQ